MEIFLIRHGRSVWNRDGRIQGHMNPRISNEGRLISRKLARSILTRFGPFSKKTDGIVSSPLRRAWETASIISSVIRIPATRRAGLKEAKLGEWEGRKVEDIRKTDLRRLQQWYRDPTKVRLGGAARAAEHIPAFARRVRKEMRFLLATRKKKRVLIIVTHGGWISALLTDVVGIPLGRMWTFVLDNSSLTRLHWDGRKLYLRSFNETAGLTRPAS